METLRMNLNGEDVEFQIRGSETMLSVLRERCGLMGTKEGCGAGDCGACTILVDDMPVNSCIMPAMKAEGRHILTVEGLGRDGAPDPIQEAMVRHGAVQCGFCASGMVMSIKGLLLRNPSPSRAEIQHALSGNLCRCGGYEFIIDAVESLIH
ncbi:(2Fe-2S)-binding protein [Oscillospiraceae bacterium]|nr:(2Fe-2S)-binding protein [Oscillospiraceae bacterium]BDF75576.1 (2Fe-2S)-binding protein [Oscillospiraceae bacterium]